MFLFSVPSVAVILQCHVVVQIQWKRLNLLQVAAGMLVLDYYFDEIEY